MALNTRHNIVRATDAYKIPQVGLDPNGVQFLMEYMTARDGKILKEWTFAEVKANGEMLNV
jgi:hypothetical protein